MKRKSTINSVCVCVLCGCVWILVELSNIVDAQHAVVVSISYLLEYHNPFSPFTFLMCWYSSTVCMSIQSFLFGSTNHNSKSCYLPKLQYHKTIHLYILYRMRERERIFSLPSIVDSSCIIYTLLCCQLISSSYHIMFLLLWE